MSSRNWQPEPGALNMPLMLKRISHGGVVCYVSPVLDAAGVRHAFSTRIGGVSGGVFQSLNLGNPNGCPIQDDPAHIRQNYRRLMSAVGCEGRALRRAHQVHGATVVRVDSNHEPEHDPKADAVMTEDAGCIASVRTADCVPVLLAAQDGRIVAAVHAGWRGIVAGVVPVAVATLRQTRRLNANAVLAAVGPSIGPDAFEVGPEVVEAFRNAFGDRLPVRPGKDGRSFIDAREAIRLQLLDCGLDPDHIDTTDRCTVRDAQEFFSHRREAGVTGRMAAIISPV